MVKLSTGSGLMYSLLGLLCYLYVTPCLQHAFFDNPAGSQSLQSSSFEVSVAACVTHACMQIAQTFLQCFSLLELSDACCYPLFTYAATLSQLTAQQVLDCHVCISNSRTAANDATHATRTVLNCVPCLLYMHTPHVG